MALVALAVYLHGQRPGNAGKAFPKMNETESTPGTMDPMKADEVMLVTLPKSQAREPVSRKS